MTSRANTAATGLMKTLTFATCAITARKIRFAITLDVAGRTTMLVLKTRYAAASFAEKNFS